MHNINLKSCLKGYSELISFKKLDLSERRKKFNPCDFHDNFKYRTYAFLCKIKYIKRDWIFDKFLHMSYELKTDIGNSLYYKQMFEKKEIQFLEGLLKLKVDSVIFDVGANIGVHTIALAKMKNVKVYSFEPSPYTRKILEYNLGINKLKTKAIIFPYAISNYSGTADFYHMTDNAYSSLKDTLRKKVDKSFKVDVITLDEFIKINEINRVDLIKIDVEGYENEVVLGARDTLRKFKPELFIEIYQGINSNKDPNATISFIKNLGYDAYILTDGEIQSFKEHSDKYYNYYFSPKN